MRTMNIETMKQEVAAYIAADAVVQGEYWFDEDNIVGGRGCFIGCLTHSSKAIHVTDRFGLPEHMVRIAEAIFENLPLDEAREFFAAVPDAIGRDGRDLSRTHWAFLSDLLRHLPPQKGDVKVEVEKVIMGMGLLAEGKDWSDVYIAIRADSAARAAARAAVGTSHAAVEFAAADAANAARLAHEYHTADSAALVDETRRQRDAFLQIIREAE